MTADWREAWEKYVSHVKIMGNNPVLLETMSFIKPVLSAAAHIDKLEKVAECSERVRKWADDAKQPHAPWCDYANESPPECCCGMDQLRAALSAIKEG